MDTDNVRPIFENTGVQSVDKIEYTLHQRSGVNLVSFGDHVNITATAYDESGNNASCSFTYEAQKVTYPNYNFSFTFSVKNVECDTNWHKRVWSEFRDLLQKGCRQVYGDTYNILESEIRVHQDKAKELVETKAWIEVRKLNQSPSAIKDCADKAIEAVKGLKGDNLNINCSNVELNFVGVTSENFTCDDEGVLQEDSKLCVHCMKGSYPDSISNQCQPCPSPDLVPHNSCQICTGDMTTDKTKCLEECQAGEYSSTGYQPCLKCATGTYSNHTRADICIACSPGKTTLKLGSSSIHDCKEICPAGYFGFLGLGECELCPKNFYSSRKGTSRCTECPAGTVTTKPLNTSPDDCKVIDHCESFGCENGGICENTDQGRYYRCECLPGYIGEHCEITVDGCLSHPCVNGGTCSKIDNDYICKCDSGYTGKNCETLIDNCVTDPCKNGNCINQRFSFKCICHTGFTGERCDINIDDCSPDPCNSGGKCIDLINDYTCNCTGTGHYGRNCSIEIEDCYIGSCLNGGHCHDRTNGFECSCSQGFTGQHCEINIDDCVSDFCKNGGVCIDGIHSYSCLCQPGFFDGHCENNIDDCKTNPCKNYGICEDRENDFYCHCLQGYEGKLCEVNHDDCSSNPCNRETSFACIDGVANFTCKCLPGWTGDHCEKPINECESFPCQHGGTCFDSNYGYSCKCKEGYRGNDCSVDIDECESNPCYNSGQCKNTDGNFTCSCLPGFEGRLCQQHVDQCQSSPCKNGGSCHDIIENFTCLCPSGWTGQLCEENINECKSHPCVNGATCHDELNDFNCTCLHGYEGKTCNKEIDECLSNPCKNGATCVDEVGGYRCQCVQGFTGVECQSSDTDECVNNSGCKNGGTCLQGRCQCTPLYTGPDCGKEKSADFDLFFHGTEGSRCQTPITNVKDTSQFSVCLWIRFAVAGSIGTVLTVLEDSGRTADEELREMLHITEDRVHISYFDNLQKIDLHLPINDGHWHHVCYTWSSQSGHWSVYRDGIVITEREGYGQGQQMPGRQRILLGQAAANIDGPRQFHGELSQLNVYNTALEPTLIKSMATNCSIDRHAGDRHQWTEFSSYIEHGIDVVIPTICGSSKCPPGFRGSLCNIPIDKEPPVVTFCPGDIRIISKDRLNIINWTEPLFGDNNGVEDIVKTHRPGQVFAYGEYNVNYVAFDAENNTASCTFKIFVLPYNCSDPPASKNTIKACGSWSHGYYCKISCIDPERYAFTETVPQVYRCGKEGFWDPPRGQIFTFPSCAGEIFFLYSMIKVQ
ncbi:hypothetical protein KUTeg_004347 [Tegillarca granosa]|uniref:Sushi, von Willebrand factor type A, EGF and pentraxin domain-containing protein 1 n=1 Tax=Tegillarca granosa TaxID=220873 RepID=A0ABQ9FSV9_TEGGR|nr:hypothetical protein KUTeg_004347 [Tegillarca granosa]